MKKKLTLVLAAAIALISAPALAADLRMPIKAPAFAAPPPPNWSGFYIGINGGWGFGQARATSTVTGATTGWFDVDGGLVGGTVGFNVQTGSVVWGIEGDAAWSSIRGSIACPNPAFTCRAANDWFGTARGRLGFAAGNWMPYITGGAAFGDVRASLTGPGIPFPGQTSTQVGWTVGAGIEWMFAPNWSAKIEYLYADLGTFDCAAGNCGPVPVRNEFQTSIIRGGINYRFNWGGPVVASY